MTEKSSLGQVCMVSADAAPDKHILYGSVLLTPHIDCSGNFESVYLLKKNRTYTFVDSVSHDDFPAVAETCACVM